MVLSEINPALFLFPLFLSLFIDFCCIFCISGKRTESWRWSSPLVPTLVVSENNDRSMATISQGISYWRAILYTIIITSSNPKRNERKWRFLQVHFLEGLCGINITTVTVYSVSVSLCSNRVHWKKTGERNQTEWRILRRPNSLVTIYCELIECASVDLDDPIRRESNRFVVKNRGCPTVKKKLEAPGLRNSVVIYLCTLERFKWFSRCFSSMNIHFLDFVWTIERMFSLFCEFLH